VLSRLYKYVFPSYFIWHYNTGHKEIFLTFDDGPTPELTPFILDCLDQFQIKATFFCVGQNIEKQPLLFQKIVQAGHLIGNHTFNHMNGWRTSTDLYFENVMKFEAVQKTTLFRPPYGRITRRQAAKIKNTHKIVMWSVLSYDFSNRVTPEQCLKNTLENTRKGDIIVFHDNVKSIANVTYALPIFIQEFIEKGFIFKTIY